LDELNIKIERPRLIQSQLFIRLLDYCPEERNNAEYLILNIISSPTKDIKIYLTDIIIDHNFNT